MSEGRLRDIAELELPYGRKARLRELTHDSGLRMLRLILREGTRITQVDIDEATARTLGRLLIENATAKTNGS
jgi:Family of unknown function (DUF6967)